MERTLFSQPISEQVWRTTYRWSDAGQMQEPTIEATWDRVALAASAAEPHHRDEWRERFRSILRDFRFLPGGRILAGAGTSRGTTLFNCFALGPVVDSTRGIFDALRESLAILQAGADVGVDLSSLRPVDTLAAPGEKDASGPVEFMHSWETANAVSEPDRARRGAVIATLRCDHPDIEAFVEAKQAPGALPHFNLSVMLGDDFMRAVSEDDTWPLIYPLNAHPVPAGGELCERVWTAGTTPQPCVVHRRIPARRLWDKIVQAEHACSEPGVLFGDRINRANNLWYCERLSASSPGGEVPLAPHGACNLGSINLTRFVRHPFAAHPSVDFEGLRAAAGIATRLLDDIHDISAFPLSAQRKAAQFSRRIGLGITGLADLFLMLGLRYGSTASVELTHAIMAAVRDTAYRASIESAQEKGAFPGFDKIRYGASPFVLELPHDIQDGIAQHGIRNSHLLAVAPARSISLLANNVSSGIEPVSAFQAMRRAPGAEAHAAALAVEDAAWHLYRAMHGATPSMPAHFVQAADVGAEDRLRIMAAAQSCVDNAISRTVQVPASASPQDVNGVLHRAWVLGLKGCAVYREGSGG
jgi:ribonucleoside-diphosphate reductase alpha chain